MLNLDLSLENHARIGTNIPLITTSNLSSTPEGARSLLETCVPGCNNLFTFKYVDFMDIIKCFNSLKKKNTCDLFGMSIIITKSIITVIAPYLAVIFNKCIDQGDFPDLMKYSKVIPLFKNGIRDDLGNYRPISILPVLSKIFEKNIREECLFQCLSIDGALSF